MDRAKLTNSECANVASSGKRQRLWDSQIPGFHIVATPSGHKSFYYRYRWNGQVRDFRIGTYGAITATQARKLAQSFAGDVARGIDIQARKKTDKLAATRERQSTLGKFIESVYGPYVMTEKKCGKEILARLKCCFGHWYNLPMSEITEWKAKRWRQDEIRRGLKSSSINRPVAYLRACLNYAYRLRVLESHPLQHMRPLKEDRLGVVRYLSADEERRLRNALKKREQNLRSARLRHNRWLLERDQPLMAIPSEDGFFDHLQPLVLLAMNTGFRKGELLSLEWRHYDDHAQTITVIGDNTKSSHSRHIPLNQEARSVLQRWRKQNTKKTFVFENPRTKLPIADIKKGWSSLRVAAGISDFRFHDLRHHFASSLAMASVDLNTIRDLLGHSDLQMTLRYAHLAPSHHAAAVAVLDARAD